MSFYFIDALRVTEAEDQWWRPYPNAYDGAAARISFGFMTEVPDYTPTDDGDPHDSFRRLDSGERALVRQAIASFEAVANVHFTHTNDEADVTFGSFDMGGEDSSLQGYSWNTWYEKATGQLWGYWDDDGLYRNEVWLDREQGVDRLDVIQHEIGHVLGLKHPFEDDDDPDAPVLPARQNTGENTVMSYDRGDENGGLGVFDVIALQSIYGPAHLRRGANTYVFGEDKLIWDGGGEDKITAYGAEDDVRIDLVGGTWNYEGGKKGSLLSDGQVFIGHFTEIENVDGGAFDDRLSGNALANRIGGREGNDLLRGRDGADRLVGGGGDDSLSGGLGGDQLIGGKGDDVLTGGKGGDDLRGGEGADLFVFARASESGSGQRDLLLDFSRSEGDTIDLAQISDPQAPLAFIGEGAFSGTAGEVRFDHRASAGTRILADLDGDGDSDFAVALAGDFAIREDDLIL